ncbi:hypothetical protein DPMN_133263 [Dreissena polymorpha]|uniref:Uncharacterized protein n=1 Tax=Dreissena polymorpha TaxID=45954 RepID=A0A9D4FXL7_DREPO|nr:hypothetical protein DPMN_133263 [Dreissena polymorpha]
MFQLLFDVKRAVLCARIQTVTQGGCTPRTQGNRGRRPTHALCFDDVNRVVQFIMNTSEEIGLPYPAAPRKSDNIPIVFLQSTTKLQFHAQYIAACEEQSVRRLKISSFKSIFRTFELPNQERTFVARASDFASTLSAPQQKKRSYTH